MDDMTPERIWVCLPEIFDALGFWYDKPQAGAVEYAPADRIEALIATLDETYARGFCAGQKALKDAGKLVIIDDPKMLNRIAALEAEVARLRVLNSAMTAYLAGEPSNPPVTGLSKVDLAAITPAAPPDTTPPPDRPAAPMPAPGSA